MLASSCVYACMLASSCVYACVCMCVCMHAWPVSMFMCDMLFVWLQLRNPATDNCLDTLGHREGKTVGVYRCHGQGNHQVSFLWHS